MSKRKRRAKGHVCHPPKAAQEETKEAAHADTKKSSHMSAKVREMFYGEFSAALAEGKAYVIPHDIDAGGDMSTMTPPTVMNLQCKLSGHGDIACAEYGFLDVRGVVGGGVMVYNSEYLSKYQQERQRAPPQNGLATHLFGDIMKDEIFGTVIITKWDDFY